MCIEIREELLIAPALGTITDIRACSYIMNTIREIQKINDQELALGIAGTPASWHQKYLQSAWIYVGNLDHSLSEGDIICVLSQFGEIEDLNLAREEDTGKSKGFAFVKYEDARSCVLAVDNLCGIEVCSVTNLSCAFCLHQFILTHYCSFVVEACVLIT
jgi:hypothetical protein